MPELPFLKFYPQDWRGDQALRVCSLAARGLWVECMSIMHFATPYGHLLVNGKPVTETQLSSLVGCPQDQVSALLAELENAGVSSKTAKGVVYSRRMTRDARKRSEAKKNGRLGGNPNLAKSEGVNPQDKPPLAPRSQSPNPESKKEALPQDVSALLSKVGASLTGRDRPELPAHEKKAIWQSKIFRYAQLSMAQREYEVFMVAWGNDEPWAKRKAEELNTEMRADEARKAMA